MHRERPREKMVDTQKNSDKRTLTRESTKLTRRKAIATPPKMEKGTPIGVFPARVLGYEGRGRRNVSLVWGKGVVIMTYIHLMQSWP